MLKIINITKINIFIILVIFLITQNTYYRVSFTQTHMCARTHKGVSKLKGLRLILVNSQIFNFFMTFMLIVVKTIKYK